MTVARKRHAVNAAGLAAALAVLASSCGPASIPTQIVVRISTDMPQGPSGLVRAVRVSVGESSTAMTWTHLYHPGAGDAELPADLALSPPTGANGGPVFVRVAAFGADPLNSLFYIDATATYVPGHIALLEIALPNRCREAFVDVDCQNMDGMTCGDPSCVPIAHGSLPVVDDITPPDAGR